MEDGLVPSTLIPTNIEAYASEEQLIMHSAFAKFGRFVLNNDPTALAVGLVINKIQKVDELDSSAAKLSDCESTEDSVRLGAVKARNELLKTQMDFIKYLAEITKASAPPPASLTVNVAPPINGDIRIGVSNHDGRTP